MVVVVFELTPKPSEAARYFDLAADLRPELDGVDGFLSVERFESLATKGKYVSISYWRDREAVDRWRAHAGHRYAQLLGRRDILADFRLTVAEALRTYRLTEPSPHAAEHAAAAAAHGWGSGFSINTLSGSGP